MMSTPAMLGLVLPLWSDADARDVGNLGDEVSEFPPGNGAARPTSCRNSTSPGTDKNVSWTLRFNTWTQHVHEIA